MTKASILAYVLSHILVCGKNLNSNHLAIFKCCNALLLTMLPCGIVDLFLRTYNFVSVDQHPPSPAILSSHHSAVYFYEFIVA